VKSCIPPILYYRAITIKQNIVNEIGHNTHEATGKWEGVVDGVLIYCFWDIEV